MGIENRDYVRPSSGGGGQAMYRPLASGSVLKTLLIVNVVVFLLQNITPVVGQWFSLSLADLMSGQVWRLLTYGFCHSTQSLFHLLINLYILWMFGRLIEPDYGHREFLAFYLTGIIVGGVFHVAGQAMTGTPQGVIGASAGVNAVAILTAFRYPHLRMLFMFVIPIELRFLAIGYVVLDVLGVFDQQSAVAHLAHLGGACFAAVYYLSNMRLTGRLAGWTLKRSQVLRRRPKDVRLYEPEIPEQPASLESRVDDILAKIHEQGEASLTDEERRILSEASRRYQNRQF